MKCGHIYKMCPAMKESGITIPDSQAGKDFCTQQCPYDRCIVFEHKVSPYTVQKDDRVAIAKNMWREGHSRHEISEALKLSLRTVWRYLKS